MFFFFWLLRLKASPSPLLRVRHLVTVCLEIRGLPRHEDVKKWCFRCICNPEIGDLGTEQSQNLMDCES